MRQRAFDVYLNDKWIDCVFYSHSVRVTEEDIKRSLIEHDGYNPNIEVKEETNESR